MQALGYSEVRYTITSFPEKTVPKNTICIEVKAEQGSSIDIAPSTLAYLLEKIPQTLQQNRPLIDELKKVHDYKVSAPATAPSTTSLTSFVLTSFAAQPMTTDQPYNPNGLIGRQFTLAKPHSFTQSNDCLLKGYATEFNAAKAPQEVLEETARCLAHGVEPFSRIRYDRENVRKILPSWVVDYCVNVTPKNAFEDLRKREQELKQLQDAVIQVLRSEGKETPVSLVDITGTFSGTFYEDGRKLMGNSVPKWIGIKIGDKELMMFIQGTHVRFME
jgi:hypothetical protein